MISWDALTPAQKRALRNPCLLAEECARPLYCQYSAARRLSVIITVNSGYE